MSTTNVIAIVVGIVALK